MARLVSYKVKDDSTYFTFENKSVSVTDADHLVTTLEENSDRTNRSTDEWKCSLWKCGCCNVGCEENLPENIESEILLPQHGQVNCLLV